MIHENNNEILLKRDFSRTKSLNDDQIQLNSNNNINDTSSHKRVSSNVSANLEMVKNYLISNTNQDNLSSTSTLLSLFPASSLPKLNQMFHANNYNNKLCTRFPCSSSLVDLIILIFRYKDICEKLIDLFIPNLINDNNNRIFQIKFNCLNNIYQV